MALSARERDQQRRQIFIADRTVCYSCKHTGLTAENLFCPVCGFPQHGTQQEQYKFIVDQRVKRSTIRESEDVVSRGRTYMFIVAGLNLLSFAGGDAASMVVGIIISSMYCALAVWAGRNPFPALLTGLLFYVSINLFFALLSFEYFLAGLLVKIAVAGTLLYAIYAVKDIERMRKELPEARNANRADLG